MTNNALVVSHLTKTISKNTILQDVNFSVKEKSFCSIIGENGAGKTTLLKIIAGIEKSSSVIIFGKRVSDYSSKHLARIVSLLPQHIIKAPFSVIEFLLLSRYPYQFYYTNSKKDKKICYEALDIVGISRLSDKQLWQLSGGELELVYLSSCIAQQPKILLADEPTTFLDVSYKKHIEDIFKTLKEFITVILVTHNIEFAKKLSDQIIALKKGKVIFNGKPDKISNFKNIFSSYDLSVDKDKIYKFFHEK